MHTATRTHGFTESVIRGMTRLANEHGAINLAQGFPNFSAPDPLKDAAARAIRDDINQYAITWGARASRNRLAPQVMAYWLMSSRIARAAATSTSTPSLGAPSGCVTPWRGSTPTGTE